MFVSELVAFDPDISDYFVIADNEYGYITIQNCYCEIQSTKTYEIVAMSNLVAETSPTTPTHPVHQLARPRPIALSGLSLGHGHWQFWARCGFICAATARY